MQKRPIPFDIGPVILFIEAVNVSFEVDAPNLVFLGAFIRKNEEYAMRTEKQFQLIVVSPPGLFGTRVRHS